MTAQGVRRRNFAIVAVAVLAWGWGAEARGQSKRPPTAEERAMLVRYRDALHGVLDQIPDEDWVESENYRFDVDDQAEVSNDPDVPLDIDESMTREYRLRPESKPAREQMARLQPLLEKMQANPTDPSIMAQMQKAAKSIKLIVNVHFNRLSESVDGPPGSLTDLKLAGAALAFKSKPDEHGDVSAVLLFGNWKAATWNAQDKWLRFHFRRLGRYPAIENIVFEMNGSPERIDALLKTVDWKVVAGALTTAGS